MSLMTVLVALPVSFPLPVSLSSPDTCSAFLSPSLRTMRKPPARNSKVWRAVNVKQLCSDLLWFQSFLQINCFVKRANGVSKRNSSPYLRPLHPHFLSDSTFPWISSPSWLLQAPWLMPPLVHGQRFTGKKIAQTNDPQLLRHLFSQRVCRLLLLRTVWQLGWLHP